MVSSLGSRRAVVAVVLFFAVNGFPIGVYAASIPTLTARFSLSALQLAGFFLVVGVFAIASMQVSGRLCDRVGARRVTLAMIIPLILALPAIMLAPSYGWLFFGGALLGIGNGGIDVSMNAIGVQVERARPKPIMSFFHGMWSVGNFAGAVTVVLFGRLFGGDADATVLAAALLYVVIGTTVLGITWRISPETEPVLHTDETGAKSPIPRSAWLMGLMAIAFGLGEGTAADWSAQLTTAVTGVDPTIGALAVTAVAGCMVVIRLLGDLLVARFGRRAIVVFGGLCSAAGYLVVATVSTLPLLLAGWSLVGLGIGLIAPQVYAAAGHTAGGRGLAVVVTFGYAAFLLCPAIIGLSIQAWGIQHAMYVPAVLLSGLVLLARSLPAEDGVHAAVATGP